VALSLGGGLVSRYLMANDAYCRLSGYTWEELSGRDFLGDIHPEDQPALDPLFQRLAAGSPTEITVGSRLIRKDGEAVPVRLTGSAVQRPEDEPYLAVFVEDSTMAEQAKAEANQLERELTRQRRMESLGHLISGIAHDFNNLLTVISSYASVVNEEVSVAAATESISHWEPVRRDMEQIQDAADRAKMLIKSMLAFARKETAQPKDVDLSQAISDARRILDQLMSEQVPIIVQSAPGVWPVRADPAALEQLIVNIAVNAKEAMAAGGRLIISVGNVDTLSAGSADLPSGHRDAAVALADLLPGPYVAIRFADTGVGMDREIARRAFDPFFTTKDHDRVAGLGLTTVQRIAAQAGGKAWLESEPGGGTTVTVVLPAAYPFGYAAAGPTMAIDDAGQKAGSVLVVDDDPQVRAVIHRVLTTAGYRVATAASGQDALALITDQDEPADLLLTDVVMPGIVGTAFVNQVRAARPGIRVLFMSGYERPGNASSGWPEAETRVLAKPFSGSLLLATVAKEFTTDAG
jgi:PAS domain S-box-containing protein